jgi:hypothetical protein
MKRTFVLFMILCLAACKQEKPEGLYELTGRIFVFNYRVSEASYMVTIAQVQDIPQGLSVVARFADPTGGAPIEIIRPAWPKLAKVALSSPPVRCVKSGIAYPVEIEIRDPSGQILQTIKTSVTSTVDQSVLAAKPLVTGPGYERNSDVFKPGGPDFSPDPDCPNLK